MDKEKAIADLYSSLNDSEKYGIRFALYPIRIMEVMNRYDIKDAELMNYDREQRMKKNVAR